MEKIFIAEAKRIRRKWVTYLKMLKELSTQRLLYIAKMPFRNEGEIKSVSGERKLREPIASKPPTPKEKC